MPLIRYWLTWLRKIPPERFVLLLLVALAGGLWVGVYRLWPRPLEVTAYAVGDGDAFLIRAPSGRTVLIDGGSRSEPEVGTRVLVPNLLLQGVKRLDAVIITHPDSDHVNGLPAVLENVPVGLLLDPQLPCDTTAYQQVCTLAAQQHIPRRRARAGGVLNLGAGTRLYLLAPGEPLLAGTGADENNNCVVGLLIYGRTRLLFTGDLEEAGEAALLARAQDLRADILKVAHHGSRHGTGEDFLAAVQPTIALISASGSLQSGHPDPQLLARLRAHHIRILRTDISGRLQCTSDGRRWRVRTYR